MPGSKNATDVGQQAYHSSSRLLSTRKQILFSTILCIAALLCVEVGIRVTAYFIYGKSPYFLFYGFASAMADDNQEEGHSASFSGYFKFQPSRVIHQYGLFLEPTPIRINSLGFRGKDFTPEKPLGTFRVICLGESSTFGFYDRDPYTYPAILERLLADQLPAQNVEVINAGIPHANSDNLLAMFRGELLTYKPDLITIYAGFNDAAGPMDTNWLQEFLRWVHMHSATYVALKRLVSGLGGPELYSRWAKYSDGSNQDYSRRQIELHVSRYDKNIRDIVSLARINGIQVIFIKQAMDILNNQKKDRNTKMSYAEEVLSVRDRLDSGNNLSWREQFLMVHNALMETLERVAQDKHIPMVDNISILDRHPEYYASYVHLTEAGNEALAEEIASTARELIRK